MHRLDKAALSLRHVASDEPGRFNLSGIYLTSSNAVATDGHILATVANVDPEPGMNEGERLISCIIGRDDAAALEKALPKPSRFDPHASPCAELDVAAANVNGHIPVTVGTTAFKIEKVDAQFPDYQQVMPKGEPVFRVSFDLELLERLAKVIKASSDSPKKTQSVVLEFYGDEETGKPTMVKPENDSLACYDMPIRVSATHAPRFSGLLMPIRL
jgi:DNA polymerase III sliding clamp (beta) subunit (PCNA family)